MANVDGVFSAADDWLPRRDGSTGAVQMPADVIALRQVDGRLLVDLADGRTVDLTDWFTADAKPN